MKIFLKTIFFLLIFLKSIYVYADPNTLLGEALKANSSINENMPQEQRIETYGRIFQILDEIISDHSSSDQAIKLLSNQNIGDFDQNIIKNNYIQDLTEYYDIVCETSPNYSCLGFVSLKIGQESCKTAETVRQVIEAHQNIKNAVSVFTGQNSQQSFIDLSLSQYRACLSESAFEVTDYAKDLFSSDLVEMLLNLDDESLAKALIQNMKTPAFKAKGVLVLAEYQDKPFDREFNDRLVKFIDEKLETGVNRAEAGMELASHSFRRGEFRITFDDVRNYADYLYGRGDTCDPFVVRNYLKNVFDFQENIVFLNKERRDYNKGQVSSLIDFKSNTENVLNSCYDQDSDLMEYQKTSLIHGNLLLLTKKGAKEFRRGVLEEDWTMTEQFDYMVRVLGRYQELFEAEYGIRDKAKGSDLVKFGSLLNDDRALFAKFKQLVDYGNVCESSKVLFQQINGKNFYDDAIEYMIKSKNIDISSANDCGDSELELLLN